MSSRILDRIPDTKVFHWAQREDYADFTDSPPHTNNRQSALLDLPRELRDIIYAYFLEAHRPSPPSPPFSGPRIFRLAEDENGQPIPQKDIAYPVSIPRTNIHALLHTNRSIRSEILELVDKRNQSHAYLPAELDLMVTGYVLYPLWTRLPCLPSGTATSLDLTVNMRVFSAEAFRANDGWPRQPGVAFRCLLTLLNQFLTCGPAFARLPPLQRDSSREVHTPSIDTLTVWMVNYDIYTPRMFPPAVYETVRRCKALALRADVRPVVRRVRVVVDDSEGRFEGLEGREWEFEVLGECDEDDLFARRLEWEDMGFWLVEEGARFDFA